MNQWGEALDWTKSISLLVLTRVGSCLWSPPKSEMKADSSCLFHQCNWYYEGTYLILYTCARVNTLNSPQPRTRTIHILMVKFGQWICFMESFSWNHSFSKQKFMSKCIHKYRLNCISGFLKCSIAPGYDKFFSNRMRNKYVLIVLSLHHSPSYLKLVTHRCFLFLSVSLLKKSVLD